MFRLSIGYMDIKECTENIVAWLMGFKHEKNGLEYFF